VKIEKVVKIDKRQKSNEQEALINPDSDQVE